MTILLKCDSIQSLQEIFPSLIDFLLSQLTDRNSSLCSQVTTVLISLILRFYEELGSDRRDEWFSTCIDPIIESVFANRVSNHHIFAYVFPALFNIKYNLLSPKLQEEYNLVKQHQGGNERSIFNLRYYFIQQVVSDDSRFGQDPETAALYLIHILKVNKQAGLLGKEPGDYLGNQVGQLSQSLARQYAQCGNDEIRLGLFDLICSSLYVGVNVAFEV